MSQEKSKFELLRNKDIIHILDGDVDFWPLKIHGKDSGIKISMPYLSLSDLYDISKKFGMIDVVREKISRWKCFDDLLAFCIQNKREMDLISFLFSREQFEAKLADELKDQTSEVIEDAYSQIVNVVIDKINDILHFSGNELVYQGNVFVISEIGLNVNLLTTTIDTISKDTKKRIEEYIKNLPDRAMKDIMNGDYDSALTKARTLLEEVFFYVIAQKNENPSEKGDIRKLYNQVKQLYSMRQNEYIDKRINDLLSGLEKILSAITEMRNKGSDAHGLGENRIDIADYQARLFVNSAIIMADYILSVSKKSSQ